MIPVITLTSHTTIAETYRIIDKIILNSKFKFRNCSGLDQRIYGIPQSLLEFEIIIDRFNFNTKRFDLIRLRWFYIGPDWKYIQPMEVLDYKLPEDFREFFIFNLDLFSKDIMSVYDLFEALRENE